MIIPNSVRSGVPCVSPNSLRIYGGLGFDWPEVEPRGCPRQYYARYGEQRVKREDNEWLRYGRVMHRAIEHMEKHDCGPEEALEAVWDIGLSDTRYAEALKDLRAYISREASPLDRYGTWATEVHLETELYVDEEFGPTNIQGIIDRISIDDDTPDVVHLGDWKSGFWYPSVQDVKESAQLKTYVWLIMQLWETLGFPRKPRRVVVHLDLIKWRELPEVVFTDDEMEAWYAYTVAVCRTIWRDEDHKPRINPGCAQCPVRDDCPAFQGIPDFALELLNVKPDDRDDLVGWRDKAATVRTLLDKAVKEIDERFRADAMSEGEIKAGGYKWLRETQWANRIDLRKLHELIGVRLYDEATITKTRLQALQAEYRELDLMSCLGREPIGTHVTRTKE
jgi:hypothetical protein